MVPGSKGRLAPLLAWRGPCGAAAGYSCRGTLGSQQGRLRLPPAGGADRRSAKKPFRSFGEL
jgi:hypothetical protein